MAREDLGIYLRCNGGAGSVGAFLEYCDLRGFAAPDKSNYGYSRPCQVIGNFMGADGNSLGSESWRNWIATIGTTGCTS